ncbi:MAG: hypothetical protein JSU09_14595 [Bacteroidetes bacterium]|nr:hypothetical protein [Bacteroidota bacterium]
MEFEDINGSKFTPLSSSDMISIKGGSKCGAITMGFNPDGSTWHDYIPDEVI